MITINESSFYFNNIDCSMNYYRDNSTIDAIHEQLYAQMMGWA